MIFKNDHLMCIHDRNLPCKYYPPHTDLILKLSQLCKKHKCKNFMDLLIYGAFISEKSYSSYLVLPQEIKDIIEEIYNDFCQNDMEYDFLLFLYYYLVKAFDMGDLFQKCKEVENV
ncbi:MAG: hypothetical protein KatS3mg002_0401 [Candidatus Woesearchaeota archaeon]|nr:MAG: hypothetical protein KatS3mg002_0401 [Candidatus Woesearchaeota archaeon]